MLDVHTEGMERIHYAGGTILTGTEISRALLQYASALARNETSATVDIPVRDENGRLTRANLLVGPASQFVSVAEESGPKESSPGESSPGEGDAEEIVDDELVADLRAKTQMLGPRRAITDGELFADDGAAEDFEPPLFGDLE